ncbi:MAG TPA: ATP-binding protein, partial [Blastocatellia bacterium]|nr:ATP-binding protein [Blastocatellia bacterium]
ADAARRAHPLKVLHAECESGEVEITRRHFAMHADHIHLDVVSTGAEALGALQQQDGRARYDVLLLGYHLPELDALEVLKELRLARKLDVPAVLVCGQGDEVLARQALKLGATSYVVKNPGYLHQLPWELEEAHSRAELLRREAALEESQERFRTMADTAPVLIWMSDTDQRRNYFNRPWLEFTGRTMEQELGNGWAEGVHPDDHERCLDTYATAFDARRSFRLEYRLRRHDGEYRWVLNTGVPRFTPVGAFIGYIGSCIDITERIEAEIKRRRAEEQLSLLHILTMEVAAADDLSAALEVVVRRVCEKTGWALGQAWVLRQDGAALECSPAWFPGVAVLEKFRAASEKVSFPPGVGLPGRVWSSKQPAWIEDVTLDPNFPRGNDARGVGLKAALGIPILSGDEVMAVVEFFMRKPRREDKRLVKVIAAVAAELGLVIGRKRAEEELRRTQAELAHVSRVTTMGELAASIAHEVNQPLGAIVGNADICLHWLSNGQPDLGAVREALSDIVKDGHRASEVIARVRALARKSAPHKARLDLNEVVGEVLALVGHEAQSRQIRLCAEPGAGLPCVDGDRVQLQQVLLNLVMNGIEALAGVEGRARELTVATGRCEGGGVLVAVRDCGAGILPQDVDRVFKAFHTTKAGGMGMGLAISRSIVEAHGGRLWAEPDQCPGATFKFTLPGRG